MFKKGFTLFAVVILALQMAAPALAGTLPIRAYANDTVAGYPTSLRSSILAPDQEVVFVVEGPDGAVTRLPSTADLDGIAEAEFFGHQTKRAGEYRVAITYPNTANASPQTAFSVHADEVSSTQSTIAVSNPLVAADGNEKTFATVTLYDAYRNPVSGHMVKLISSRSEDSIEILGDGTTDAKGQVNFKVTSTYPGLSVLTALNTTVNVILSDREEVVFQARIPAATSFNSGLFGASLFGADSTAVKPAPPSVSGPVHHFDIEGLGATVKVNEELSPTVVARDKDGNPAKNYTGTILFAVPDDTNAVLPSNGEYTFKESDQGRFAFNLALQFSQLGRQTLQVFDKDNWDVKGEFALEITSGETATPVAAGSNLSIKSPTDGAKLGSSFVLVTGKGEPNLNLKIFDNDAKIGDSETDEDGFFSHEARGLTDGAHSFYVMSNQGDISSSVGVTIDTLAPVLRTFNVAPDGPAEPGASLAITLQSEPDLEYAAVRLQGVEAALERGFDPGTYEGTVAAPQNEGNFPLDVILTDRLGNKADLFNQRTVRVELPAPAIPPVVEGLDVEVNDGAVALTWKVVTAAENPVARYRVYFGTHFDQLSQTRDTDGPVNQLVMGDLVNGTQYFFAVKAVDAKGLESEKLSLTVAATPKAPEPEPSPVTASPVSGYAAVPLSGGAQLSWPAFPGVPAFYYKVYFGVNSGQYDDFTVTVNNTPSATVYDLINGVSYYFRVAALDLGGAEISALSPEFSVVPGAGLRPAASVAPPMASQLGRVPRNGETGPEAWLVILASSLLAFLFYHHKKRVLR